MEYKYKYKLWRRCLDGDVEFVKAALDEYGARDVFDNALFLEEGCIHAAAQKGQIPVLDFLIRNGEDVNRKAGTSGIRTPLYYAVRRIWEKEKRLETVNFLLQRGAEVDARYSRNFTPLLLAAYKGRAETARLLLLAGANIEAKDDTGETALRKAIRQ